MYMSFWTKEGEVGNSQVVDNDQTYGKYIPACLHNSGHRGEPCNRMFLDPT